MAASIPAWIVGWLVGTWIVTARAGVTDKKKIKSVVGIIRMIVFIFFLPFLNANTIWVTHSHLGFANPKPNNLWPTKIEAITGNRYRAIGPPEIDTIWA